VEPLRKALEENLKKLVDFSKSAEESLVDKRLVAKLIVTYFEGKADKSQVLELIARVLSLSDEEKVQVGLGARTSNWLPFFGSKKQAPTGGKGLTDLWVDFLLKEAAAEQTK
jgi:hypothetical protein